MLTSWLKIRSSIESLRFWQSAAAAAQSDFSKWVRSKLDDAAAKEMLKSQKKK